MTVRGRAGFGLGGEAITAASAGIAPTAVHPMAIQAMSERGVDIGDQRSKSVDELEESLGGWLKQNCLLPAAGTTSPAGRAWR